MIVEKQMSGIGIDFEARLITSLRVFDGKDIRLVNSKGRDTVPTAIHVDTA